MVTTFAYISSNSNQIRQTAHSEASSLPCSAGRTDYEETKEGGLMAQRDGASRVNSEYALVNKRSLTMCTAKKQLLV